MRLPHGLLAVAFAAVLVGSGWAADAPTQTIPVVAEAPTVDGSLADAAWQQATPFSPFLLAGTKSVAPVQTQVQAVVCGDHLIFGVTCLDPDMAGLKAAQTERDSAVWEDDAVEVFINPGAGRFFQFLVNPNGALADLAYPAPEGTQPLEWNAPGCVSAAETGDAQWTAELSIPLAEVWAWKLLPQQGEHVFLKICRRVITHDGAATANQFTSWNELPGRGFTDDSGWRAALIGQENLIADADLAAWVGRDRPRGTWTLENPAGPDGAIAGAFEVVTDPEPGVPAAIRVTRLQAAAGQNPRLFCRVPLRPDHTYRLSLKVRGEHPLNVTCNSRPWLQHNTPCFTPPAGGWVEFTEVSHEFTVGKDSNGNENLAFFYLWLPGGTLGEYLIAEARLAEVVTGAPLSYTPIPRYHGLKSLAESNFGVKPLARLNRGEDDSYDSSRVIYRDQGTGAEIWKVTHFIHLDRLLGTGHKSWTADGMFFAFTSYFRPWTNATAFLNADATRVISQRSVSAPMDFAPTGHNVYSLPYTGVYEYDPATGEKTTLFELPEDKKFPGRNWISFSPQARKVLQYAWQFGKDAVLRVWDLNTGTYRDIPTKTQSEEAYKDKDWLYSAGFKDEHTLYYGMNHLPNLSEHNVPQGWYYDLDTGEYTPTGDPADAPSHGATSPGGKQVGYFREGLAYRPSRDAPKVLIGGLGGDGHMAFLYQDEIAVSGDVSDESLVTMIYPDTRTVVPVAYAQNRFTGYYGSIVFVSMSPDVTKMVYSSDMLGYRDLYWAITNYPQTPVDVRVARAPNGLLVRWERPKWSAEITGYLVYRSGHSGRDYRLLTPEPIEGTEFADTTADPAQPAFYVLRSVERSKLVSRMFSCEAAWQPTGAPRRIFFEAENPDTQQTPFRITIDRDAANEKCMWVRQARGEGDDDVGKLAYAVDVQPGGEYALWARVRQDRGGVTEGRLTATIGAARADTVPVTGADWRWVMLGSTRLPAGELTVTLEAAGKGLSVDRLLLTDDPAYTPQGRGSDVDIVPPPAPGAPTLVEATHFDLRIRWQPVAVSTVTHYQVYRTRGTGVEPTQTCLVGSPSAPELLDYNLRPGEEYSYLVTAVDDWGHESPASPLLLARTEPLAKCVETLVALSDLPEVAATPLDGTEAPGLYRFTDAQEQVLEIPFELGIEGDYVIWLHGAPDQSDMTSFSYRVDDTPWRVRTLPGKEIVAGQQVAERVQWDRLMDHRQEAGTVWHLTPGPHVLCLAKAGASPMSLVLDKIMVTNDFSTIPPGERFLW